MHCCISGKKGAGYQQEHDDHICGRDLGRLTKGRWPRSDDDGGGRGEPAWRPVGGTPVLPVTPPSDRMEAGRGHTMAVGWQRPLHGQVAVGPLRSGGAGWVLGKMVL